MYDSGNDNTNDAVEEDRLKMIVVMILMMIVIRMATVVFSYLFY